MRKVIAILVLILSMFVFATPSIASPGGLDKNGGHYCRKSDAYCAKYGLKKGQYHCHRKNCVLKPNLY
jgi:hypothetical protein